MISLGSGLGEGECYSISDLFVDGEKGLKHEKNLADGSKGMMEKLMKPNSALLGTINEMIWKMETSIFGAVVRIEF